MRLLGAGDNVVDRYVDDGMCYPGGNAVNVAVFAARQGAESAYLGVIGNDDAGRLLTRSLIAEGVDISRAQVGDGPNAWADVALRDGDRVFLDSARGIAVFEPAAEHFAAMGGFDVVHSGYAGPLLPFVRTMAKQTRVSFDFGSGIAAEQVSGALQHLFLATFSRGGASSAEARKTAQRALAAGAEYALVTRGAQGAILASAAGVHSQGAHPGKVVDTLGAGDALITTVLLGLLNGLPPATALESGSAAAAEVCSHYGAFGHGEAYRRWPAASAPVTAEEVPGA